MTAFLVGEAPTDNGPGELALTGRVGRTMARLAGIEMDDYLRATRRRNIFDVPMTGWDRKAAAEAAQRIAMSVPGFPEPTVVLLGCKVAEAFGFADRPLYERFRPPLSHPLTSRGWAVRVPHPSGRNLQLNDPEHRQKMGAVLREAILG